MIKKDIKENLVKKFGKSANDTGSCEVQVALLSARIHQIADHLKVYRKDFHSKRGLTILVGKRRRLLRYLQSNDVASYTTLVKALKDQEYL
jgi:small subunit ribosomal protein S15